MQQNENKPKSDSLTSTTPDPIPEVGVKWSKKSVLITIVICFLISALGVFGYLFYQEYKKKGLADFSSSTNQRTSYEKIYSNDYWGYKFSYPPAWRAVIGSFDEGDYFFASEPIDFLSELSPGQALIETQPFNNLKKLPFNDWVTDREKNYFPYSTIISKAQTQIQGYPAWEYQLALKKPINGSQFWDMIIISKDDLKKYIFILETDSETTSNTFKPIFNNILNSVKFYQGFGT